MKSSKWLLKSPNIIYNGNTENTAIFCQFYGICYRLVCKLHIKKFAVVSVLWGVTVLRLYNFAPSPLHNIPTSQLHNITTSQYHHFTTSLLHHIPTSQYLHIKCQLYKYSIGA
ncbi:MAG: hypothetical protein IPN94_05565 [Sphingobacteriales bacterium]|nr:hypothetical protein [Sphingobacteriales bacterium]